MAQLETNQKLRISSRSPCLFTLRIELLPNEIQPIIWRRLEVDGRISLCKLHHLIQAAFGWNDSHLHQFEIRGKTYAIPSEEDALYERVVEDERKAKLNRLVTEEDVLTYSYDLGDNWQHVITVENIDYDLDHDPQGGAFITDGARACPPEDVGGPDGYHHFLEVILTQPHSDEAKELLEWAGGPFDPHYFDKRSANAAILRLLYNGWGGK
jgi:hypothetical protein